jgi:hypothetical protein
VVVREKNSGVLTMVNLSPGEFSKEKGKVSFSQNVPLNFEDFLFIFDACQTVPQKNNIRPLKPFAKLRSLLKIQA